MERGDGRDTEAVLLVLGASIVDWLADEASALVGCFVELEAEGA